MRKLSEILEEAEIIANVEKKEDEKDSVEEEVPANSVSGVAGLTEPIHPKSVMKFVRRQKKDKNTS